MNLRKTLHYGILAALFLTPLLFSSKFYTPFTTAQGGFLKIATEILLIFFIIYLIQNRFYPNFVSFFRQPTFFFLILFFSAQFIATIFSIAPIVSIFGDFFRMQGFFMQLHYLIFVLLIIFTISKTEIPSLLLAMSISGSVIAGYGFLQKLGFDPFFSDWDSAFLLGRIFSFLGQPNFLGAFLILTIAASIYLLFIPKFKKISNAILILVFFQIIALILTSSRSAFLGFGVFILSLILYFLWLKNERKKIIFILGLLSVIIFSFIALQIYAKNKEIQNPILNRFVLTGEGFRSIKSRLLIFPSAIRVFLDRPLFGSGPETFSLTFPRYQNKELLKYELYTGTADRVHNEFLDILVTSGVLGLAAYFLFLFALFVKSLRQKSFQKNILLFGLLGFIAADQLGFQSHPMSLYFWTITAILFILSSPKIVQVKSIKKYFAVKSFAAGFLAIFIAGGIYLNIKQAHANYYFQKSFDEPVFDYSYMQKASKIWPLEPLHHLTKGKLLLKYAKKTDDLALKKSFLASAQNSAADAYGLTPQDREIYVLLGEIYYHFAEFFDGSYFEIGNYYFQKAFELSPTSPVVIQPWADNLYRHKAFKEALAVYRYLLSISPDYWKWTDEDLAKKSFDEKEAYRKFFKDNPGFLKIVERVEEFRNL